MAGAATADTPLGEFATNLLAPPDTSASDAMLKERGVATEARKAADARAVAGARAGGEDLSRLAGTQAADRAAALPPDRALPAPPSTAARSFLDPGPNASMLSQMQTLLLGVGQIGLQARSFRGSAIGATVALKGALEGWQQGDLHRVERSLVAWDAATKRLLTEHKFATDKLRALVDDQKLTWDERFAAIGVNTKALEWDALSKAADVHDIDATLKQLQHAEQQREQMRMRAGMFSLSLAEKKREFEIRQAETERRTRQAEEDRQRGLDLRESMLALRERMASDKKQERESGFTIMGNVLTDMDAMVDQMAAAGLLPKDEGVAAKWGASAKRGLKPNQDTWRQWTALQGAMVGFERQVFNDKGARALAVYKSLLEFVDNPPTPEGAHAVIQRMQGYLKAGAGGGEWTVLPPVTP